MERGDANPTWTFCGTSNQLVSGSFEYRIIEAERLHRELGRVSTAGLKEQTKTIAQADTKDIRSTGKLKGRLSTRREISGVAPQASQELGLGNAYLYMNSPEDWRRVEEEEGWVW